MKRNKALPLGIAFAFLCASYVGYCLRAFLVKPPLQFGEFIDPSERKIISDWYDDSSEIRPKIVDFESVIYALSHPYLPNPYRPFVSLGGLGGEGSIQFSYEDAVAIFVEQEGKLVLSRVMHANDAEPVSGGNGGQDR